LSNETQTAPPAPEEIIPLDQLSDSALRIQLDKFEGPFEVLLYLIRAQEIDIFDIPIVKVTEQYLRFLDLLREENLDVAGDFLVMAATLIQIKSRMILPVEIAEEEEEVEEEDPRLELVEKLLEYRKFRDLTQVLTQLEERTQDQFGRRVKPKVEAVEDEEEILDLSLYDLIKAVRSILRYVSEAYIHEVKGEGASVDEKIALIEQRLLTQDSLSWTELFEDSKTKVELVCCLLAILELCRMHRIRVHQQRTFGEIRLFARTYQEEAEADVVVAG
jgi:segregation and condensation protein A